MSFLRKIHSHFAANCWSLGFIEEPLEDIVDGKPISIHYLKHNYRDRWFADPWLLKVNDKEIKVLVEEYTYREERGYISLLTIDRKTYELISTKPVLKLDSHLSFPAIMYENGKTYIYPENAGGEGLGLYELDGETKCKHIRTISKDLLADAVITDVFGEQFLFSTHLPTHNGNVLSIHRVNVKQGTTDFFDEVTFKSNIARNAGNWFKIGDKVFRPAQDCNGGYGIAVILQEVKRDSKGSFVFKEIRRLTSTHSRLNTGLHTFNHADGLSVIDVRGKHYPKWVATISDQIFNAMINTYVFAKSIVKR